MNETIEFLCNSYPLGVLDHEWRHYAIHVERVRKGVYRYRMNRFDVRAMRSMKRVKTITFWARRTG